MELLEEKNIDGVFEYLEIYKNSLSEDEDIADVEKLIKYYNNNRQGLLPYQEQIPNLPEPHEGLQYRNLGTMENHIWSIIAKRMKHNHTSWSRKGGNHLAKILAKKCSGKLYEVTEKLRRPIFEEEEALPMYEEILTAAQMSKKEGKGYRYPVMGHLVGINMSTRGDRKKLNAMAGY